MIIRALALENYKQYKKETIEFHEGLVGIVGKNGSGKSSIFEAILLALFGEIPFTKEYLRNHGAPDSEPVSVSLDMEVDGHAYTVRREYRGKNLTAQAELRLDHATLLAKGQKEVTAAAVSLIGMGKDAFTRSIFSSQKELGLLSDLRGGERREFIRKVIGVARIDEIQELIRQDATRLRNEIEGQRKSVLGSGEREEKQRALEQARKAHEESKAFAGQKETGYQNILGDYEKAKDSYIEKQIIFREHSETSRMLASVQANLENIKQRAAENTARIEAARALQAEYAELQALETEYQVLKKEIEALDPQRDLYEQKERLVAEQKALNDEKERREREYAAAIAKTDKSLIESEKQRAEKTIDETKREQENETGAITLLARRLGGIQDLLAEQRNNLEILKVRGPHSACPLCLRPLEEYFEPVLEKIADKINEYTIELDKLKKQEQAKKADLDRLKDRISLLEADAHGSRIELVKREQTELQHARLVAGLRQQDKEIASRIKELGELSFDLGVFKEKITRRDALDKEHNRFTETSVAAREIPVLEKERDKFGVQIEKIEREKSNLLEKQKALPYSEKEHAKALELMTMTENARENLHKEQIQARQKVEESLYRVSALEKELAEDERREKSIREQESELVSLKKLDLIMNDFKKAILERMRPAIAGYASSLFESLTRGRYDAITIDENFGFLILDDGEYFPLDRFSGGEQDLANLCLRLALSKAVQDLEGAKNVSLLAFDEIFGSQDRERRFEILAALARLSQEYRQILVISHIDEMKDEFPQILEVRRTADGSKAAWVS